MRADPAPWSLRAGLRLWEAALSSCGWQASRTRSRAPSGDPEAVRDAMQGLAAAANGRSTQRLKLAIQTARDLRGLWYLRSSLMQALAGQRGELQARQALAELDALFLQAWPAAPVSRPAPLG